ncbi:hypothetical protein CL617_00415 [archaeon]|nr:hypothetical protein [archaeon]|tara:strand:+ start:1627 stop:1872 length:246 start_codon:yes stop_codon:yes gene_type:complete
MLDEIKGIISTLETIKEDDAVPKNIRSKINSTLTSLNEKAEINLTVDRVIEELDEVSNDANLPPYTRIEIMNVISVLGGIQ